MADAYLGTTKDTVPPPSSKCPACGRPESTAASGVREGASEILYACANGHLWLVRWTAGAA